MKILGANLLIALTALAATASVHVGGLRDERLLLILGGALALGMIVNTALVTVALRPLGNLERAARRIWQGDINARVPDSLLADQDLRRVGGALNVVLDRLTADRTRVRALAARVIRAGDEERARFARELHESAAQSLAALLLELSVVSQEVREPPTQERVTRIRQIVREVLDEVESLARAAHPRVLDDLGLGAALQGLARDASLRKPIRVEVVVTEAAAALPPAVTSVFYRVAQEALANAVRHSGAARVRLNVGVRDGVARLEVADEGRGFRVDEAERRRPGMGLFVMRERVALMDGSVDVDSAPGRGTRVVARIRVPATAAHATVTTGDGRT